LELFLTAKNVIASFTTPPEMFNDSNTRKDWRSRNLIVAARNGDLNGVKYFVRAG